MSKNNQSNIRVSIIITAHNEGIVAHKTILSIIKAIEPFDVEKIPYEIIIGLDNPDKATSDYFKRWRQDKRFRFLDVSFGNPADNRNNAAQQARGEYISMIDGDDMVSSNWLIDSFKLIQQRQETVILHPEAHMQFGFNEPNNTIWLMSDSLSKEEDAIIMTYWNRWTNANFARRSVFLDYPYTVPINGFGYEDYNFNCQTRAAGIPHLVTPQTVLFYRRKENSVTNIHWSNKTVLGYTDLFDTNYLKSIPLPPETKNKTKPNFKSRSKNVFKKGYRLVYDTSKRIPTINKVMSPMAKNILYKKRLNDTPKFIFDEWRKINAIENQLYPTKGAIAQLQFHPLSFNQRDNRAGLVYRQLLERVTKNPDYLFLTPKLYVGGTEKLLVNYIKALQKAHPKWQIAVLANRPSDTSEYQIPDNVDFIDFDEITKHLSDYERDIIWPRLLIQLKVKRLHLINNEKWYRWIADHKTLLQNNGYKVYISLFMREYTHEKGRVLTFADPCLTEIYPVVSKVFTDNQNSIDEALENNAFDKNKLVVHYQPQEVDELIKPKIIDPAKPLRILWASRLSFQKRLDILREIAQKLDNTKFQIDAYGRLQHYNKDYLNGITSLEYKGSFRGIKSINPSDYDVYLYTSETDGVPNVLLEITAAGLPIIASDAGGVHDFIKNGETGRLVDIENVDGYVEALGYVKKHPNIAQKWAGNAQKLLKSQHSVAQFEASVKRDIK